MSSQLLLYMAGMLLPQGLCVTVPFAYTALPPAFPVAQPFLLLLNEAYLDHGIFETAPLSPTLLLPCPVLLFSCS